MFDAYSHSLDLKVITSQTLVYILPFSLVACDTLLTH